jgi:hypothetical protein
MTLLGSQVARECLIPRYCAEMGRYRFTGTLQLAPTGDSREADEEEGIRGIGGFSR